MTYLIDIAVPNSNINMEQTTRRRNKKNFVVSSCTKKNTGTYTNTKTTA